MRLKHRRFPGLSPILCLLLLAAALAVSAAPAFAADNQWGLDVDRAFCPRYGVACYKALDRSPVERGWLEQLWSPDGVYMGSVHLPGGQCGFIDCEPCAAEMQKADWDCICNQVFAECNGACFSQ